jgi:hypothetical protein
MSLMVNGSGAFQRLIPILTRRVGRLAMDPTIFTLVLRCSKQPEQAI